MWFDAYYPKQRLSFEYHQDLSSVHPKVERGEKCSDKSQNIYQRESCGLKCGGAGRKKKRCWNDREQIISQG